MKEAGYTLDLFQIAIDPSQQFYIITLSCQEEFILSNYSQGGLIEFNPPILLSAFLFFKESMQESLLDFL